MKPNRLFITNALIDARARTLTKQLKERWPPIIQIEIVDVYTIDKELDTHQLKKIAELLTNPVTQQSHVNTLPNMSGDLRFEIGFLPGVTDNIGSSVKETIQDLLKKPFAIDEGVYSSTYFFVTGALTKNEVTQIIDTLMNPLIQRFSLQSKTVFVPRVILKKKQQVTSINLAISDEKLEELGKNGIKNKDGSSRGPLALPLHAMHAIQSHFKKLRRSPTDIELESLAQTWSEHCKHTIFASSLDELPEGLYRSYIKAATALIRKKKGDKDFCVSVFHDNSGIIKFDENFTITDKVETHNSPSALDPFGGAVTGILGVNRDTIATGLGAKPILNRYFFCFGEPDDQTVFYRDKKKTQPLMSSRRIMDGVIKGINFGGNCSGIPTPHGGMFFDKSYRGKPLVFAGCLGLLPTTSVGRNTALKKARVGDYIVMVGGRVGADGIHGATFSSTELNQQSPSTAVQIGDPITQKMLSDAITKEARDLNLYNSITDNGAGGLSCSVAEMARECGGCFVELDRVPLKYPGLDPWAIWISESQERITLSITPKKWDTFFSLMAGRGIEATVIGTFTNSGKCVVSYNKKIIVNLEMAFLHNGLPLTTLTSSFTPPINKEPKIKQKNNYTKTLLQLLSSYNIASAHFLNSQYDYEVQGTSVLKPLHGRGLVTSDAAVVRPLLTSDKGVVVSSALHPRFSAIDTYHMAANAIDSAICQAVAVGADPNHLALLDNFCWASSNDPQSLALLKRAAQACYEYSIQYETPFISGKDSMFNDFHGYDKNGNRIKISALPTLLISSVGVVENIQNSVTLDVKFPGDLIYLLGETHDELGASEYYYLIGKQSNDEYIGNNIPKVNALKNSHMYETVYTCIKNKLLVSAISVGVGGLAPALAKKIIGGMLGATVDLSHIPGTHTRTDSILFAESSGRLLVTIAPGNKLKFENSIKTIPHALIGKVTEKKVFVINKSVRATVEQLKQAYRKTFTNN